MKYLYVDDQLPQQEEIAARIRDRFREPLEPFTVNRVEDFETLAEKKGAFDDIAIALIDLELGPRPGPSRTDEWGGTRVLPLLRRKAPWIPAICVSQWLETGDALSVTAGFAFDALLSKQFFHEDSNAPRQWNALKRNAALLRVSALTGRDISLLAERIKLRPELTAEESVTDLYRKIGEERFRTLLALLLPQSDRIVFDQLVQGFSGLSVIKAHCLRGSLRSVWLVKWGLELRKLQVEATAHRQMFEDGFTREYSVPLLWPNVVAWEGLGGIAYEFAEGAMSFLEYTRKRSPHEVANLLGPMLARLYRGAQAERELATPLLQRLLANIRKGGKSEDYGPVVQAVCTGLPIQGLEKSLDLFKGAQHGDLHARNIMVVGDRPLLIDFVHYLRREQNGVPLLDLAKLLVDLCAFNSGWIDIRQVHDGSVFSGPLAPLLAPALGGRQEFSPDERIFWSAAAACLLAEYTTYDDLPSAQRQQFLSFLREVR